jgi:imidazolonepropionase-like amidohydrolase
MPRLPLNPTVPPGPFLPLFLLLGGILGGILVAPPLEARQAEGPSSTLSPQVREYVSVDAPVVALVGVRVVDGTGAEPLDDQVVLIRNGRIARVGPVGAVEIPADAERHELPGHTVIPGLVGMHNHTFYTTSGRSVQLQFSAPRLYLGSGVTTIRTTGAASPYSEINMMRQIDQGEIPGPRMHVTGPYITGAGASGHMLAVTTPEEARRVVAYWAEEGATWFKAYTLISRAELQAAVQEAHRLGLKFTGHLCSVSFREAVALGIDNLEHGLFTNSDYDPTKVPDQCPTGMRTRLAEVEIDSPEVQTTIREMIDAEVGFPPPWRSMNSPSPGVPRWNPASRKPWPPRRSRSTWPPGRPSSAVRTSR